MCITESLCCTAEIKHNIVNKKKKKKEMFEQGNDMSLMSSLASIANFEMN